MVPASTAVSARTVRTRSRALPSRFSETYSGTSLGAMFMNDRRTGRARNVPTAAPATTNKLVSAKT